MNVTVRAERLKHLLGLIRDGKQGRGEQRLRVAAERNELFADPEVVGAWAADASVAERADVLLLIASFLGGPKRFVEGEEAARLGASSAVLRADPEVVAAARARGRAEHARGQGGKAVEQASPGQPADEIDFGAIPPAPGYDTLSEYQGEVDRLAGLPGHEYDRCRRSEAKRLGVRVGTLDADVKRARPSDEGSGGQGREIELPEVELWAAPVGGAELIGDLIAQIRRFIVLSDHAALAVALWVVFAHAHDAAFHSPRLALLSPTHRCGKSTLMRIIGLLVVRKLVASSITASAIFRAIEAAGGVVALLIDELDNVDREKASELVAIINAGHCRLDAHVTRTVPVAGELRVRQFSCWAATVLAAIKRIPITWMDRSVVIRMARKERGARVERLRIDHDLGFDDLASRAARWAADHIEALRRADPPLPAVLNDRQADNWRMLAAIADLAGGGWGARARVAAAALSTADIDDFKARGELLLGDIRDCFDATGKDRHPSVVLVAHLNDLEGRPWHEYSRGNPMSQNQLANLLRPFGISPGTIRVETLVGGSATAKGYMREAFEDAWKHYLSPPGVFQAVTPSQVTATAAHGNSQTVTKKSGVTDRKSPKATATATCDGVTDQKGGPGGRAGKPNGAASTFEPTDMWQDLPPGAVLPAGLWVTGDVTTGKQRVRIRPGTERCPICGDYGKVANHDGATMCASCAGGRAENHETRS